LPGPRHDLIAAVKNAAAGNALLAPSVTIRLIDAFTRTPAHAQPAPSRLASLTAREHDILLRLARGLTNAEIAADLVISEATVKSHVGNLLAKLGLRDRIQAVILASGLLTWSENWCEVCGLEEPQHEARPSRFPCSQS
jgi:DNA-binding NarL/FixJ family response regulator